jgi:hypothetical protein
MAYTFKSPTNSTRTSPAPTRSRNNKQKARRAKAKAPSIKYSDKGNQRANLPSEVAKQYAQPANTRPVVKTTAVASNNVKKASDRPSGTLRSGLIPKNYNPSLVTIGPISDKENQEIDDRIAQKKSLIKSPAPSIVSINKEKTDTKPSLLAINPKIKTTMGTVTDGYGVNAPIANNQESTMMASLSNKPTDKAQPPKVPFAQFKTSQDPKLLREMGITKQARPQFGPLEQGVIPLAGTVAQAQAGQLEILKNLQANPLVRPGFNKDSYDQEALVGKDSLIRGDKYRNDEVSYNQAYWKAKREGGASQAEMAAEQKALGSKKTYSGDRVISEADQDRAKYALQSLRRSGIDPTVTSETSGFFDEMNTTTSSYDIGTGKPMTTTRQQYSPIAKTKWGNLRLGDDVTKTFVNGVAVYTQKNDDPATTSETGSLNQRSQSSPDPIKEMADIDSQIKTETDPAKLKALHKRRLMLMRMNRTNTRFAGLLGEADTKRTNLMSIS